MFSPSPERIFRYEDKLYAKQRRVVPAGRQCITFDYAFSSGWNQAGFCRNVRIIAPPRQNYLGVQLVVNEAHVFYQKALNDAQAALPDWAAAADMCHDMLGGLASRFENPAAQEAIVGNMGKLALAHGMRILELDESALMSKFYPLARSYYDKVRQTEGALHTRIDDIFQNRQQIA